ncbi:uncharacterized protein LOC127749875 isoform X1 [Frankliniella occidentalis]|uniref:Uncharacterized protein LOC113206666 isoform X1 n=2 Tax=Frankliniella occidentalis TaxID=133901 RepID=A0A6J1SC73_FRAOC|nr:uncharacterized protein LOC113206666 isoform X1 [Frankliniella occidentalis]XP_052125790.1 uncharacterized protein LOC127749875 isoform X1 [Frankliniella occidentalis]
MSPSKQLSRRWRSTSPCVRRAALCGLAALVVYVLMSPRAFLHVEQFTIEQARPKDVWDFLADFSNMPKLNPTILDWELLSDGNSQGHWRYSVRYTERLSGLPSVSNYATAHFEVIPAKSNSDYLIRSTHSTCFYTDFLCLPTASETRFSPLDGGMTTLCTERIEYACPWVMSGFCKKEVLYQRNAIRENLKVELYSQN